MKARRRNVERSKRPNAFAACGLAHAAIGVAAFLLCACSGAEPASIPDSSPAIERTAEKGPVKLTVRAGRSDVAVGQSLPLTVDVLAETGVEIQMPRLGDSNGEFGSFEVIESITPPDIPEQGKRRWTHRYTVRTLDSGEQEIPAISIKFKDRREAAGDDVDENELSTDSFTIGVRSLLEGDFDPKKYRDIKSEVAVALPWNARPWVIGGLAAFAMGVLVTLWLVAQQRKRRGAAAAAPPLPPHVWALQQLDQLAAERLLERADPRALHEFFFRLSAIVRQYIEQRFSIMAAEQTTDEFLREARRHPLFNDSHRSLLTDFLRQADMVKFAKFQPPRSESDAAMQAARRFVQETANASTDVPGDADGQSVSAHAATTARSLKSQTAEVSV